MLQTRRIKIINDDGEEVSDEEDYYVDDSGKEVEKPDAVQQVLSGLNDTETEFMRGLGNDFLEQMAEESLQTNVMRIPVGVHKKTRWVKVINDDGDEVSDEEDYYVDDSGKEVEKPDEEDDEQTTHAVLDEETSAAVQQVLAGLNDMEMEFMKGLGDDFMEQMTEESLSTNGNRQRTVTMEENDEALQLAMEQYAKLTIPWKKEQLLMKTKRDLAKRKKKREEKKRDLPKLRLEQETKQKKQREEAQRFALEKAAAQEENDEALQLAMEQYAKLTIPWKKEQLLMKTKRDLAKRKKKREEKKRDLPKLRLEQETKQKKQREEAQRFALEKAAAQEERLMLLVVDVEAAKAKAAKEERKRIELEEEAAKRLELERQRKPLPSNPGRSGQATREEED
eukprot:277515_1